MDYVICCVYYCIPGRTSDVACFLILDLTSALFLGIHFKLAFFVCWYVSVLHIYCFIQYDHSTTVCLVPQPISVKTFLTEFV
jgi:hypothetical protein